jgi:hypothetical protein
VFVKFWYVLLLVWLLLAGLAGNKDKPILKLVSSFHYEIGVWFLGLFHGPIAVCTSPSLHSNIDTNPFLLQFLDWS